MATTDPDQNLEYVKKSQATKKETSGIEELHKIHSDEQAKHRGKL